MRCDENLALVEDYFDGELDGRTAQQVAQHLSACASCAAAYQKLEREQGLYLTYECDAQPAPDFWDGVMLRATQESRAEPAGFLAGVRRWFGNALGSLTTQRFSPQLTALLVLAAIGVTAGLMRYFGPRDRSNSVATVPQSAATPAIVSTPLPVEIAQPANPKKDEVAEQGSKPGADVKRQTPQHINGRVGPVLVTRVGAERGGQKPANSGALTPDELVRQAEQKYVAAITLLKRDARSRRSQLDDETAARFERTLAAIDRTIADTRRAARQHPGDPVAAQYMLAAYSKKVDVLREIISY